MTKIILIGPPGAGKGTQAENISQQYELPCISTGQILRQEIQNQTDLGQKCQQCIDNGELVPDHLILEVIHTRLLQSDCSQGYILDGFPRTLRQAQALASSEVLLDGVIYINVRDEVIIERLAGRWIHLSSGRVYHEKFNPPKVLGKDDLTGESLTQRKDDKKESIQRRLISFREDTQPVIDYYLDQSRSSTTRFIEIDGDRPLNDVFTEISAFMNSLQS